MTDFDHDSKEFAVRTYDISDKDMETIRRALDDAAYYRLGDEAADVDEIEEDDDRELFVAYRELVLEPVCNVDERLVYTVAAFREHFDGAIDADAYVLEHATDEQIVQYLGDEYIYNAWAETCDVAMHELQVEFANEIAKEQGR